MSRFKLIEVSIPHLAYILLGGFIVFFGMFSLFIREKLYIGEACWAFLFGVIIGPYCANIFDPRDWGGGDIATTNTIVIEFTRVVLAIGVFAIGVELPKAYMARHWKSLFFLLFPVMTWGWFVSAGLIYALIPGLNFLSSLAVAACLTPTDPILAAAVVGGKYADKHVPAHLRHLLAAESGCNDGAAFPFLFIALYLTIDKNTDNAIKDWFLLLWLYQIAVGIIFGAVLGFGFRYLMKFCQRKDLIDRQSYVAQYVSLAMLTIGANTLLGADDLLAAFSCGTAFAWDGFFNKQTEEAVFSSVIDLLFNIAAFIFIGAWMPFDDFSDATLTLTPWRLIVIAILILLLRRLPVMIALYRWIPDVKTLQEAIFSGHFGPMGIGAVFIATLAVEQLPEPESPPATQAQMLAASIQPIVAFMVLCSITIHGLSIPFFSLGRRVHSVSRTWSRHDTFGTLGGRVLPEWTTQTRPVVAGEDIVINRDRESAMEAGVLPPHEKGRRPESYEMREESTTTQDEKEEGSSRSQDEAAIRPNGTDMREENLPDGEENVQEWREGQNKVVERRRRPGEDVCLHVMIMVVAIAHAYIQVEVEVQDNAFGPKSTTAERIDAAAGAAANAVNEIKSKIRRTPRDLENALHDVEHDIEEGTEQLGHRIEDAEQAAANKVKRVAGVQDQDEEEGWMSDASEGDVHGSASSDGRKRAKKSTRSPPTRLSQGGSRRRTSMRRRVLSPRVSQQRSRSEDTLSTVDRHDDGGYEAGTEASEGERGRRPPHTSSTSSVPRAGHARIESLCSMDLRLQGRDQSPARSLRSVHFADEYRGNHTPSILRSPSFPATPSPGSEAPSEGENESPSPSVPETPRNGQVRFSLPDHNERR
ncbi:uncharacterized protein LAESUDRAFT_710486 [Laetiporus sulphureus 93-53]|uniref:Cation/H+ exchanger transmembrane domain-containing protein n=1 Tax=Laetiporus sulphureus 93-53 TaxID=1314785 RepID=A0A165HN99_9APHY|nr:uncharacterized protein LAESUDRAFT_710486 [Laetiporus sulphureus 93-53]KZT11960.1 hypothetical protein LAESUDRAFT_710486 [Laetiporus sulphureus 93-53]